MFKRFVFLLIPVLLLAVKPLCAQLQGDQYDRSAKSHVNGLYHQKMGEQAGVFSGLEYIGYPHTIKEGSPFFITDEGVEGQIYYDGLLYTGVTMWYDLGRGEVVVWQPNKLQKIALHTQKVERFSLSGHDFIKIDSAAAISAGLKSGFYDRVYDGASEILVARTKDFIRTTSQEGIWTVFSKEKGNIFLRRGREYHQVSGQKSVLRLLAAYEREILVHLKQNKVKFRQEPEKAIKIMAAYYDQLSGKL